MLWYQRIVRSIVLSIPATLAGLTIFLLSACNSLEPTPQPIPAKATVLVTTVTPDPGFAFVFEWSSCGSYTLNTFDNKLTLRTNTNATPTTIDFVLSKQESGKILQKMADVKLSDYPEEFSIQLPRDTIRVYGIPASYRFDVRNGGQRKVVTWSDDFIEPIDMPWKDEYSEPSKTRAIKLRELIKLIQEIVEIHPEYDQLPDPGGCA